MNRDLVNCIEQAESIRPQVATGAVNGEEVDLRDCDSASIVISIGAITGSAGDATVTLEESDTSGSGFTAVVAGDILGSTATLTANTSFRFGYSGDKRYIRAVFGLGGETNVAVSALVVKGHLDRKPAGYSVAS
jgi:hypothetical protein